MDEELIFVVVCCPMCLGWFVRDERPILVKRNVARCEHIGEHQIYREDIERLRRIVSGPLNDQTQTQV